MRTSFPSQDLKQGLNWHQAGMLQRKVSLTARPQIERVPANRFSQFRFFFSKLIASNLNGEISQKCSLATKNKIQQQGPQSTGAV